MAEDEVDWERELGPGWRTHLLLRDLAEDVRAIRRSTRVMATAVGAVGVLVLLVVIVGSA